MKTVIEMAREAGFEFSGNELTWESVICTEELERFAELVRADEREACAKVCDIHARGWEINPGQNPQAGFIATSNCAAAIRARSNT